MSCERVYFPGLDCEQCTNVNIKGILHVEPTGEKLNNLLVEVLFREKRASLLFPAGTLKVISGKTDENGVFNFTVAIDTTLFKDYELRIMITRPKEDYISSVYDGREDLIWISFWEYNAKALQNLDIAFFKKAILTINLNRTETDDCEYLRGNHFFDGGPNIFNSFTFRVDELVEGLQILQKETGADVYTKITWEKTMRNGESLYYIDSLICRQNKDNIFKINY